MGSEVTGAMVGRLDGLLVGLAVTGAFEGIKLGVEVKGALVVLGTGARETAEPESASSTRATTSSRFQLTMETSSQIS